MSLKITLEFFLIIPRVAFRYPSLSISLSFVKIDSVVYAWKRDKQTYIRIYNISRDRDFRATKKADKTTC